MSETNGPEPGVPAVPDEAPEADAAEQRAALWDEERQRDWPEQVPFDADEADAADQTRVVETDEDDYR